MFVRKRNKRNEEGVAGLREEIICVCGVWWRNRGWWVTCGSLKI